MLPALDPVDTSLITAAVCADSGTAAPPILTGIHLAADKIVCTDRYRLAAIDFPAAGTLPEVVVPAKGALSPAVGWWLSVSVGSVEDVQSRPVATPRD